MTKLPDFTFELQGEGVSVDPATGRLSVATEALLAGVGVVLTARDATGTPTSAFRITVTLGEDEEGGEEEEEPEPARAAPKVTGALADLALTQGAGAFRVETAGVFSGADLVFAVAGGAGVIEPATGALDLPLGTLRAGEEVRVSATNAAGSAEVRFALTITAPLPAAPVLTGALADQVYALGEGSRSISTQALFGGAGLTYALEAAPGGVTIQPGSGLVTIPTGAALDGTVTVRAENAGGAARLSFRVTVRAMTTVFSEAAALGDLSFLATEAAPALSFDTRGFAKLVPATSGRTHGIWAKAGGDGLYRALARWSSGKPAVEGNTPFVLGLGIGLAGGNLTGAHVAIQGAVTAAARTLRIFEYTGAGTAAVERAQIVSAWAWDTLYWVEAELVGTRLRARLYPEAGPAPDWMVTADLANAPSAAGGFGPGGLPLSGTSPTLLVKRLDFAPVEPGIPPAATDADWSLSQVTE